MIWEILNKVEESHKVDYPFPPPVANIVNMINEKLAVDRSKSATSNAKKSSKILKTPLDTEYDMADRLLGYRCFECDNETMIRLDSAEEMKKKNDKEREQFELKLALWKSQGEKGKEPKRNTRNDDCFRIGCCGFKAHFSTNTCHECFGQDIQNPK